MITNKKYDVHCKGKFIEKYPNFSFLLANQDLTEMTFDADNMVRYVVYLYSVDCPLHKEKYSFDDRKLAAMDEFKIPKSFAKKTAFLKVENTMAYRFMSTSADVDFELYVSSKMRHGHLCYKLRITDEKINWKDDNDSITTHKMLMEMGKDIKAMEDRLFGNIEELKKIIESNKNENMSPAETHAMN